MKDDPEDGDPELGEEEWETHQHFMAEGDGNDVDVDGGEITIDIALDVLQQAKLQLGGDALLRTMDHDPITELVVIDAGPHHYVEVRHYTE